MVGNVFQERIRNGSSFIEIGPILTKIFSIFLHRYNQNLRLIKHHQIFSVA